MVQRLLKSVLLIVVFFAYTHVIHAATLSVYPGTSNVSVGNIVSLSINVNSSGESINTAAATLHFPTDMLEVMSVSKSSSIFSLWPQDPVFSNGDGTVTFTGGLPNPGFIGQSGQVVSIVFRAKRQGNASLFLSDASVLANDGLGTNVLTSQGNASVKIGPSAETPVVTTSTSLPPLPIVTSTTNPDQDTWYPDTTASFSWVVPKNTASVQTLLSSDSKSLPVLTYDSSVSQRTVNGVHDGIFYFRIRYVNAVGAGPVGTYKVQIDSTPPKRFVVNVETKGVDNIVALNAIDAMSGIDGYSIQIDGGAVTRVQAASLVDNTYTIPTQNPGQHTLSVLAYDKAGNHTESNTVFTSPVIAAPRIEVSEKVMRGDTLSIHGETKYSHAPLMAFVQSEGGDVHVYTATTDDDGSYSLISDPMKDAGPAHVWAQLVFSSLIKSPLSEKVSVQVTDGIVVKTSKSIIYGLSFIIPAVLLILVLVLATYFGWYKFFSLKKRFEKETEDTIDEVHKTFIVFKDELENQLDRLKDIKEDRDLNKKEEKIFKELRSHIESIDDVIEKKIKKIK